MDQREAGLKAERLVRRLVENTKGRNDGLNSEIRTGNEKRFKDSKGSEGYRSPNLVVDDNRD